MFTKLITTLLLLTCATSHAYLSPMFGYPLPIGGTITGGTTGSVLFVNPTGILAQDNDNYFWDNTNKRLGIGTPTPASKLDVVGVINGTSSIISGDTIYSPNGLSNSSTSSNAYVQTITTGTLITRDAADANPAAIVQQVHASSTGDVLQLKNNASTLMTVKQGGSVGIGITAPSSLVHVRQTVDSVVTATPIGLNVDSVGAAGELTAASSVQTFAQIAPIINQTSTAGYTALKINPTETSTGSGVKLLADFQVGAASKFSVNNFGKIAMDATNTAGGTTGAQTINKPSGTVNFAAAASSLVVTNSLVTTSSIVHAMVRTNDSTAIVKNVVPAAGSFTITLNASATAETSVGFVVFN